MHGHADHAQQHMLVLNQQLGGSRQSAGYAGIHSSVAQTQRPARNRLPIGFVGDSYHGDTETRSRMPPQACATALGHA
jgi:hypothetical protein